MESINNFFLGINSGLEYVFSNKLISNLVLVFLMLYISLIVPPLPESTEHILENGIIQMILIILIGYITTKNLPVVVISTVALIITLQMMKVKKFDMNLVKRIFRLEDNKENFEEIKTNSESKNENKELVINEVKEQKNEVDVCADSGVIRDFNKLNPNEQVQLVKKPVIVENHYTSLGSEYSNMIIGTQKLDNYGELN